MFTSGGAGDFSSPAIADDRSGVEASLTASRTTEAIVHFQSDPETPTRPRNGADGRIHVQDRSYDDWLAYRHSSDFGPAFHRCGNESAPNEAGPRAPTDCDLNMTNPPGADQLPPATGFDPIYRIPVVVHVIQNVAGDGFISEADVAGQIEILNQDYRAIAGSPGAGGIDTGIEFHLASTGPDGSPSTGVEYLHNDSWYADAGAYWTALSWDPERYLNIYTNNLSAPDLLGYSAGFPASGIAGAPADRVVIRWQVFGPNAADPTFNRGRTLTHEVGHYLGLYHTFQGGCSSETVPTCFSTGDRICDTPSESEPHSGCVATSTCGSADANSNYMNYADDDCMDHFTAQQAWRLRCTMREYRPALFNSTGAVGGACCLGGENCVVQTVDECASAGGAWKGANSNCGAGACPVQSPVGACCFPDGNCVENSAAQCLSDGGNYHGDETSCNSALCAITIGACCDAGSECTRISGAACVADGGTFYGEGSDCADECVPLEPDIEQEPDPSPQPALDRDGDGVPDAVDECPDDGAKQSAGVCGCGVVETPDCGAAPPAGNEAPCCGGGAPAALPFMIGPWIISRRRNARSPQC